MIACIFYGDMLCALRSQVKPYEDHPRRRRRRDRALDSDNPGLMRTSKNFSAHDMKKQFPAIAADYAKIPRTVTPKVKVGVVGRNLCQIFPPWQQRPRKFLESQGLRGQSARPDGLCGYCIANQTLDVDLYGGSKLVAGGASALLDWLDSIGMRCNSAMRAAGFYAPGSFRELMEKPKGIISLGAKMGEGWLLTAEMIELVEGGYPNIVCASRSAACRTTSSARA